MKGLILGKFFIYVTRYGLIDFYVIFNTSKLREFDIEYSKFSTQIELMFLFI